MDNPAIYIPSIFLTTAALYLLSCVWILYEFERGIACRLGWVLHENFASKGEE